MDAGFPLLSSVLQLPDVMTTASPPLAALLAGGSSAIEMAALGTMAAGLALTFINLNKSRRQLVTAQRRVGELEYQLNEVEAALHSESQILLVTCTGPPKCLEARRPLLTSHPGWKLTP
jgi:hypothetical protein